MLKDRKLIEQQTKKHYWKKKEREVIKGDSFNEEQLGAEYGLYSTKETVQVHFT